MQAQWGHSGNFLITRLKRNYESWHCLEQDIHCLYILAILLILRQWAWLTSALCWTQTRLPLSQLNPVSLARHLPSDRKKNRWESFFDRYTNNTAPLLMFVVFGEPI